jgi:hypothetical protein
MMYSHPNWLNVAALWLALYPAECAKKYHIPLGMLDAHPDWLSGAALRLVLYPAECIKKVPHSAGYKKNICTFVAGKHIR